MGGLSRPVSTIASVLIVLAVGFTGCGRPRSGVETRDRGQDVIPEDIVAEAYLFDARVKKDDKPTSVRLEIYRTDTVIAFNGRGYLGKGAFRGIVRDDTLLVYFPTIDEFTHEPVADLLNSLSCRAGLKRFDLDALFEQTPDSVGLDNLVVDGDYEDEDHPVFVLRREGCEWALRLEYDRRDERWWLDEFYLESGPDFELRGRRRTLREQTEVPRSRFDVSIPAGAVRLIP
ncbi:hypothetical protein GF356_11715 [candidate division GN15 bacterium]|nr:hypothetical protein [candidate division GN15 bacterium]